MSSETSYEDLVDLGDGPATAGDDVAIDDLIDPDAKLASALSTDASKYEWDQDFQREILGLAATDRPFFIQIRSLVEARYFSDEVHERIASILFNHFDRYNELPNRTQLRSELRSHVQARKDEVQAKTMGELEAVLGAFVPGAGTRTYYREKVTDFAQTVKLKQAVFSVMALVRKNPRWAEIHAQVSSTLRDALTVNYDFEEGQAYFEDAEQRYEDKARAEEEGVEKQYFTTGFDKVDADLGGGLMRGEVGAFLAQSGGGKSLALKTAALKNVARGHNVCYITCELSENAVAERFDAEIAFEFDDSLNPDNLLDRRQQVYEALKAFREDHDIPLKDRRLIIKFFPAGSLTNAGIRSYFQQLKLRGWVPDLVIIDYVGEMQDHVGMKIYESRERIMRDIRGLCGEEQYGLFTALQPNRDGKKGMDSGDAIFLDDRHLGDSYGQVRPLDALWSLNQTMEEKEAGYGRVYEAKHRRGKGGRWYPVKYDMRGLLIKPVSQNEYDRAMREHRMNRQVTAEEAAKQALNDANVMSGRKAKGKAKKGEEPIVVVGDSGLDDDDFDGGLGKLAAMSAESAAAAENSHESTDDA